MAQVAAVTGGPVGAALANPSIRFDDFEGGPRGRADDAGVVLFCPCHDGGLARRLLAVALAPAVITGRESPGEGADEYSKELKVGRAPQDYFTTQRRYRQWQEVWRAERRGETSSAGYGTVGAVALDRYGNLAAATSTGGMTSHAAVVARGWGKCCVAGAGAVHLAWGAGNGVAPRRPLRFDQRTVGAGDPTRNAAFGSSSPIDLLALQLTD